MLLCTVNCVDGLINCVAGNTLFDASQYEFFGQNVGEEVELGGLEDDRDGSPVFGSVDDEYHLFDKGEVRFVGF